MADFSGGAAITSGFRLISRRPGAVLLWGLVYVLLAVVPQFLLMGPMLPDILAAYREALQNAQAGGAPGASTPDMLRLQQEMGRFQPLQIGLSLISFAIVNSAVYRAILDPDKRTFGSLRLGMQELWVGLTLIAFYALVILAAVVAVVVVGVVAGAAGATGGAPSWGGGLAVFLAICGAVFLLIWICLRLSLALPMTFAERRFRLLESWGLTRGLGWKLFGVALALACIIIALEFALMLVVLSIVGVMGAGHIQAVQAFLEHPPADWASRAAPILVGICAFYVLLMGLVFAIMTAPFAEIYRELAAPQDAKVF
jgi:hypothetical protein